jgi:hypothetical protein
MSPDDEAAVLGFPIGYRPNLIMIAMTKKWLAADKLPLNERLFYLEELDKMAFGAITPEVVAAIEPACSVFEEIFTQAMRVNTGDNQCETAFGILERDEVFQDLLRLNPSLSTAFRKCRRHG